MKSILMIVTIIVLTGCRSSDDGGGGDTVSTTPSHGKESSIMAPPGKELKAQGYDNQYVQVANTKVPDYDEYRKQWKRVNDNPHEGYKLVKEKKLTEINLDDLSFKEAFIVQYRAKGEGHTFWWQGHEYTTNLLHDNPSVDKE